MSDFWTGVIVASAFWAAVPLVILPVFKTVGWAVIVGVRRYQEHIGISRHEMLNGDCLFVPNTREARAVLAKHCRGKGRRYWRFGLYSAWVVPADVSWDVYESCSHDADNPQCMISTVAIRV